MVDFKTGAGSLMNLEHLVVPESKEVLKQNKTRAEKLNPGGVCQRDMGASVKDLPVDKWNNLSNKICNRELDYNPK